MNYIIHGNIICSDSSILIIKNRKNDNNFLNKMGILKKGIYTMIILNNEFKLYDLKNNYKI
ncbi:hypothetical protein PFAG_05266 [Plasmodium falciparum Santa Lucia]|uniref:Uncharacterized protein n=4 Tax=Plasmodium falciparum TaxID=5833 RepID=A0A024W0R2_PLAFA|nr:hypothetical protein PFTANZ_05153 [Plasmodium falciparum Tanzania (2000708)]ETW40097.1 hypothetical protein PFNF135_06122 [Plasmodium falciparum NF135/5.C10]EUR64071.1 hypothetical protein PFBG_05228 [Plasmodium falciparum 7G8]EUT78688.1 hypothetical protein PFAG_05266 [Plasmodium falciparum Santa Lucia]